MIYIYGLREVNTDLVFYVGATINVRRRLNEHKRWSNMKLLRVWIDSFNDETKIEAVVLERVDGADADDKSIVQTKEHAHIRHWFLRNPDLCNVRGKIKTEELPLTCPACRSPYWNKKRRETK